MSSNISIESNAVSGVALNIFVCFYRIFYQFNVNSLNSVLFEYKYVV